MSSIDVHKYVEYVRLHFFKALDSLRGQVDPAQGVEVLLALYYVRSIAPASWNELTRATSAGRLSDFLGRPVDFYYTADAGSVLLTILQKAGRQSNLLRELAHIIASLEIPENRSRGVGAAELFCEVLASLEYGNRKHGDAATPPSLVNCMVQLANIRPGHRIYDPFCRSGELLVGAAYEAWSSSKSLDLALVGSTPDEHSWRVATLLTDMSSASADVRRLFALDRASDPVPANFDAVVTNPPFNMRAGTSYGWSGPWEYGEPPAHNSNFAWLQLAASALMPDGTAVILMPGSAGTSENQAESAIRKRMVEAGIVDCVIALPPQLFRSTNVAASIWVLCGPGHARNRLLFIDATEMGEMRSRAQRILSGQDVERIVEEYRRWRREGDRSESYPRTEGFARSVGLDAVARNAYQLNPQYYLDTPTQVPDPDRIVVDVTDLRWQLRGEAERAMPRLLEDPLSGFDLADLPRTPSLALAERPAAQLGQVCDIMAGPGTIKRGPEWYGWTPVVLPRSLKNGRIVHDDDDAVPTGAASGRYQLQPGDVVTTRIGELGRTGVVAQEQSGWLLGPGCIRLRPTPGLDGRFLAYYLSSPAARAWLGRNASGAAIKNISTKTLGRMPIVMPPIDNQLIIANLLGALDDNLGALDHIMRLTETLRDQLAALLLPYVGGPSEGSEPSP